MLFLEISWLGQRRLDVAQQQGVSDGFREFDGLQDSLDLNRRVKIDAFERNLELGPVSAGRSGRPFSRRQLLCQRFIFEVGYGRPEAVETALSQAVQRTRQRRGYRAALVPWKQRFTQSPTRPLRPEAVLERLLVELPIGVLLLDAEGAVTSFNRRAAELLARIEGGNGRLGVVGFCYGGGMANFLATRLPELAAAAPFYGSPAPLEDVPKIKAEMLVVLAANDERINTAWPAYEAALKAAGVTFSLYQPAGTQHGFNNDTTPRYDEAAAREAWRRTLALFDRTLRKGA